MEVLTGYIQSEHRGPRVHLASPLHLSSHDMERRPPPRHKPPRRDTGGRRWRQRCRLTWLVRQAPCARDFRLSCPRGAVHSVTVSHLTDPSSTLAGCIQVPRPSRSISMIQVSKPRLTESLTGHLRIDLHDTAHKGTSHSLVGYIQINCLLGSRSTRASPIKSSAL